MLSELRTGPLVDLDVAARDRRASCGVRELVNTDREGVVVLARFPVIRHFKPEAYGTTEGATGSGHASDHRRASGGGHAIDRRAVQGHGENVVVVLEVARGGQVLHLRGEPERRLAGGYGNPPTAGHVGGRRRPAAHTLNFGIDRGQQDVGDRLAGDRVVRRDVQGVDGHRRARRADVRELLVDDGGAVWQFDGLVWSAGDDDRPTVDDQGGEFP